MQSAEIEKLIQIITDRVWAQLKVVCKSSILFQDQIEAYPAPYVKKLSADYHFDFGQKQDSDAILLCLNQLTMPQLIAVARLTAIDPVTTQMIDFLLKGKPVWIFSSKPKLQSYRKETRYAVWRQLQTVFQRVLELDIHFIDSESQFNEQLEQLQSRQLVKPVSHGQSKRHFITEKVLEQRWQSNQQPLLQPGEVLTDLAKELAQDKHLNL